MSTTPSDNTRRTELVRASELAPEDLDQLIPLYQRTFEGPPWFEVSSCPAPREALYRCPGGKSPISVGTRCNRCELVPSEPAFPADWLVARWKRLGKIFYVERDSTESITLAALAWAGPVAEVVEHSYAEVDEAPMRAWLQENMPDSLMWLEEIFADLDRSPKGNLWNYERMMSRLAEVLGMQHIALRTKNCAVVRRSKVVFGSALTHYRARCDVPHDRHVLHIDLGSPK